ncbi:MAG: Small subunit processome component [Marteilia pararefringens]
MANKKKKLKVLRNLLDKFLDYNAPYNFLLDSTFCAQAFKIQNLDGLLEEYMNGQVKLFTTTCAISESKSLGKEMYQKSKPIFEKCEIFQCGHKKNNTKAADCITEMSNCSIGLRNLKTQSQSFYTLMVRLSQRKSIKLRFPKRTSKRQFSLHIPN